MGGVASEEVEIEACPVVVKSRHKVLKNIRDGNYQLKRTKTNEMKIPDKLESLSFTSPRSSQERLRPVHLLERQISTFDLLEDKPIVGDLVRRVSITRGRARNRAKKKKNRRRARRRRVRAKKKR